MSKIVSSSPLQLNPRAQPFMPSPDQNPRPPLHRRAISLETEYEHTHHTTVDINAQAAAIAEQEQQLKKEYEIFYKKKEDLDKRARAINHRESLLAERINDVLAQQDLIDRYERFLLMHVPANVVFSYPAKKTLKPPLTSTTHIEKL